MRIEEISEPIRVLADFTGGSACPVWFAWGGRKYVVSAINGRWADRSGDRYTLHYSVQVGDDTYYIHFDTARVLWWLDKVIPDG